MSNSVVATWTFRFLALLVLVPAVMAQHVRFTQTTDSITFDTACLNVTNQITYEAVLRLNVPQSQATGMIYTEIAPFWFDRQLAVGATTVYEYTHPIDSGIGWSVPADLGFGVWRHLAFCYDGSEERFYLDGQLLDSRPRSGAIATACSSSPPPGNGALGRVVRQGSIINTSFLGDLAWFRVSSAARYEGVSFSSPGPSDAPSSDPDTMLLFTFGDCSSGTILDHGPLGRNGTLGGMGGTNPGHCCPADQDDGSGTGTRDSAITIDDLLYYFGVFNAGAIAADLDDGSGTGARDGAVTIDDLLYFLDHFNAGC